MRSCGPRAIKNSSPWRGVSSGLCAATRARAVGRMNWTAWVRVLANASASPPPGKLAEKTLAITSSALDKLALAELAAGALGPEERLEPPSVMGRVLSPAGSFKSGSQSGLCLRQSARWHSGEQYLAQWQPLHLCMCSRWLWHRVHVLSKGWCTSGEEGMVGYRKHWEHWKYPLVGLSQKGYGCVLRKNPPTRPRP